MWTDTTRAQYARADLTLLSDLTDAEWAVLEPFFPPPSSVGRPRKWLLRRIVEQAHCRGDFVFAARRAAVADATAALSARLDSVALVLSVARQRPVALAQSSATVDRAGS